MWKCWFFVCSVKFGGGRGRKMKEFSMQGKGELFAILVIRSPFHPPAHGLCDVQTLHRGAPSVQVMLSPERHICATQLSLKVRTGSCEVKSSGLNIFPPRAQPPFCQNRLPDSYWYKWKQNQRSHNGELCFFMVYYYYQWLLCYWGLIHAGCLSLLIFIFHFFAAFLLGWIRPRTWQCCFWMDSYLVRWDQSVPSIWRSCVAAEFCIS